MPLLVLRVGLNQIAYSCGGPGRVNRLPRGEDVLPPLFAFVFPFQPRRAASVDAVDVW